MRALGLLGTAVVIAACGSSGGGAGGGDGGASSGSSGASSGSSGSSGGSSGGSGGSSGASGSSSGASGSSGGSTSSSGASSSSGGSSGGSSGSSSSSGASSSSSGATGDGGTWWQPSSSAPAHFHWQLSTAFTYPGDVVSGSGDIVYDIDGENNTAANVAQLHALGPNVKVVCYVDVGTYENFRSDAASFPASVLGSQNGWPGEQWLDVRQQSILMPIMTARVKNWCVDKGFDAVEPDNLDGWENSTGFPLTQADNLSYDLAIAQMVHQQGLSVGLKNLPQLAVMLEPNFDWAIDEQCFEFSECSNYMGFTAAGKPVYDVEYNVSPDCATADMLHMNAQKRDLNLAGPSASGYLYMPCMPETQTTW
jgi:hypothetical protein